MEPKTSEISGLEEILSIISDTNISDKWNS